MVLKVADEPKGKPRRSLTAARCRGNQFRMRFSEREVSVRPASALSLKSAAQH
jgi:hypothetical protein